MDLKIEQQVRGTRLLSGEEAYQRRKVLIACMATAVNNGFEELVLPTIEPAEIYREKAGPEILGQMYLLEDRGGRKLCLRPEGTATCQLLAQSVWKSKRDIRVFYEARCFRYERPQAGRYREFTQFGVEILNPRNDPRKELLSLAEVMVGGITKNYEVEAGVKRGLAYYVEDGFEILCPILGAQKQVLGGGRYKEGVGFAIGVDRLALAAQMEAAGMSPSATPKPTN